MWAAEEGWEAAELCNVVMYCLLLMEVLVIVMGLGGSRVVSLFLSLALALPLPLRFIFLMFYLFAVGLFLPSVPPNTRAVKSSTLTSYL